MKNTLGGPDVIAVILLCRESWFCRTYVSPVAKNRPSLHEVLLIDQRVLIYRVASCMVRRDLLEDLASPACEGVPFARSDEYGFATSQRPHLSGNFQC